jgi:hypothetical protein
MIPRKEFCEYCNEKMENKNAKKRFCSDKCRVYASRLKKILQNADVEADKKNYELPPLPQKKPIQKVFNDKPINPIAFWRKPAIKPVNDKPEPPVGLKGIDLVIWKSENWK